MCVKIHSVPYLAFSFSLCLSCRYLTVQIHNNYKSANASYLCNLTITRTPSPNPNPNPETSDRDSKSNRTRRDKNNSQRQATSLSLSLFLSFSLPFLMFASCCLLSRVLSLYSVTCSRHSLYLVFLFNMSSYLIGFQLLHTLQLSHACLVCVSPPPFHSLSLNFSLRLLLAEGRAGIIEYRKGGREKD
jgi:hypothetical protein